MFPEWMFPLTGIIIALISSVWGLAWWLSKQFDNMRNLIYEKIEWLQKTIIDKLEYHEKHDDDRFKSLGDSIWEIKIRNAAKDGYLKPIQQKAT